MAKRIGVLAVQGAFAEHEAMLSSIGAECRELRSAADLEQKPDALVLPGGESTVQRKLLMESGMLAPIKSWIEEDMPVLATCAGLILLAEHLSNDERTCFKTLPVTVRRNAYGRQLGSFHAYGPFGEMDNVPMTFIRAPFITEVRRGCNVLATCEGNIVAVQYGKQLGMAFHPELDDDNRIHELFLSL